MYIESNSLKGYAYNDNTGWLSFETGTTVTTTWAPATISEPSSSGRSGQRRRVIIQASSPSTNTPTTIPALNTPSTIPTSTAQPSPVPALLKDTLSSNPRDLEENTQGEDVKLLQQFLNQQGFLINTPGQVGSLGYETNFFGSLTRQALIKFQQANQINPPAGYFGPITRAFIKSLTAN